MENTPQNVRYLRLGGVILSIISITLFTLAYHYLPEIDNIGATVCLPSLCIIALGLFAFINAFYTFKFSLNINEDSFAKWLVVQYRFWLGIFITIILLVLAFLLAILTLAPMFTS